MKEFKLNDLLTDEEIEAVSSIIKKGDIERWKKLREYLQARRPQLEAKGVVPEYLAYYLEYQTTKGES